jgi:ketosteroid isomerase-like protein
LEARAHEVIAAINAADVDRMLALGSDDITWADAMLGVAKGADNLRRVAQEWFGQFEDTKYTIRQTVVNGNLVGVYYNATATAGGRRVAWNGAFCLAFNPQGKISGGFEIFDAQDLAKQVGR